MDRRVVVAGLLLLCSGCSVLPTNDEEERTITEERVVLCPPQVPEGVCPKCPTYVGEPGEEQLGERLDRASKCEQINDGCRAWHDLRDTARATCEHIFATDP